MSTATSATGIAGAHAVANAADIVGGGGSQRRRFTFIDELDTDTAAKQQRWRGGDLSCDEEWVSALPDKSQIYKRVAISFDATAAACTHAGFIQYLHACWAAERGVVLRPDVIWHAILCELARMVRANPAAYSHLFTGDSTQRRDLEVATAAPSDMDARALAEVIRQNMREPALADAMLSPCFASAPPLAAYAAAAALCAMGEPFYRYMPTMCGIPSVDVVGDRSEWESLERAIARLMTFAWRPPPAASSELQPHPADGRAAADASHAVGAIPAVVHHEGTATIVEDWWSVNVETLSRDRDDTWLAGCQAVVQDIIHWGFDATDAHDSTRFFSDVFHYGKNHECGSGHATMLVSGWARRLVNTDHEDIADMPRHVSVIPFVSKETGRSFVQAVSLAYSEATWDGLAWEPQYGVATFEAVGLTTNSHCLFDVLRAHASDSCVVFQTAAAFVRSDDPTFAVEDDLPLLMAGVRSHSKNRHAVKSMADAIVRMLDEGAEHPKAAAAAMQGVQRFHGIATLLQALQDTDDDAARKSTAMALGAFSRPALVDALVTFKHNCNIVRALALALCKLPRSVDPVTATACDAAVMPVLVDVLRLHVLAPTVAKGVVATIETLANRCAPVPRDGVQLLLTILNESPCNSQMVYAVAWALVPIATKSTGGLAMFHATDIGTLLGVVRAHTALASSGFGVAAKLAALCNVLVLDSSELCAAFVRNGAVPLFVEMVHLYGTPVAALARLSMAHLVAVLQEAGDGPANWAILQGLKTVTADDELVALFVHAGGILPLVRALEVHGDDVAVAIRAVDALGKLATSAAYAPLLVRAGGAPALQHARRTMMRHACGQHEVERITHLLNGLDVFSAGAEEAPLSAAQPEPGSEPAYPDTWMERKGAGDHDGKD